MNKEVQIIGPMNFEPKDINVETYSIIVDGGSNHRLLLQNFITVGDNDSSHLKEEDIDYLFNKEKDYSDLRGAFDLISPSVESLYLFGFSGGRRDHDFINITECYKFLLEKEQVKLFLDKDRIFLAKGKYQFEHLGTFSISTLINNQVSIIGDVKFPYIGTLEKFSSHGLSNVSYGQIEVTCHKPVILFLTTEP